METQHKQGATTKLDDKKGQVNGMVSFVVGVIVLVVLVAAVAIPVITDQTTAQGANSTAAITGTEATVLTATSALLAAFLIVVIARALQ